MFLRTLLFFVVVYFLVKIISRLFLPSSSNDRRSRNGFNIFFRNFQQFSRQNQRQNGQQEQKGSGSDRFEEIEEAEYEEITEEEKSAGKSSD